MIKAIIFDFFGVIYDDNFDKVYANFGGDVVEDRQLIRDAFHSSHKGEIGRSSEIFAERFGVSVEDWERAIDHGRTTNKELLDYISQLRIKYKVSVLSNIGTRGLKAYVPEKFLNEAFDDVVESSRIGFAKPEARAFEIAADRLGVRLDECVFTDDRDYYIEGAQHVGMKTVHYKDFEQFKKELELILA